MEMRDQKENLSMAGTIRTKGKCPKCARPFQGEPLTCTRCQTHPRKYYLDLFHKGRRLRIFCDRQGHPLDSWRRATRVIESIRYEIDQRTFDPTKYVKSDIKNFLFESRIEAWYQSKKIEAKKGNLAKGYIGALATYKDIYFLPRFSGIDVREIRTYHIQQFYEQLPDKSLKYIKNILSALENFFNTLLRHDFIDRKPVFPIIVLDRKPPKWVDFYTQIKIIKALPKKHRPIYLFLAWQGVRPGEARALKVKDIDFNTGVLLIRRTYSTNELKDRVKGKVVKPRAINPALTGLLKKCCRDKHPEAPVFSNTNPRAKGTYSESAMKRIWQDVIDAGFDITPYQATRHSLASSLLKDGAHIKSIGDILGHTDIRTTMKYAHGDLDSQRTAFGKRRGTVTALRHQTVTTAKCGEK